MKRDYPIKFSEQATKRITGISPEDWREAQLEVYDAIDEALVNALQEQRHRMVNYLQEQGLTWYAFQVRAGADYQED